jgi:hypothetical protein
MHCLSNIPGSDFEFPTTLTTTDVYACMDYCSTTTPACYGIAYNVPDGFCYLKNSSVVGTTTTTDSSTHSAFVTPFSQLLAADTSCPFDDNSAQNATNGMEFDVHCGKDIKGGDFCPTGTNATCPWHAASLSDCMNLCSASHPLCSAVSYNADMLEGYANCYPKSNVASAQFVTGEAWITHSAVATITNITVNCANNANITASNNKEFSLQCNQNRAGNDITVYHDVSLQKCAETCATYTNNQCVAVIFDGDMELGWENCYLKSGTGTPLYNSTATFALMTGVKDTTSSGSSSSSSSSSSSGSKSSSHNKAWIAGLVVGLIVLLALIIGIAIVWRRRSAGARHMGAGADMQDPKNEYQYAITPETSVRPLSSDSTAKQMNLYTPVELADTQMPHEIGSGSKRSSLQKYT